MEHCLFSRFYIQSTQDTVGAVPVAGPAGEHPSGTAGVLQCRRIHVHNLQCSVCTGKLEACFQIDHAFSERCFFSGEFHIFIMNCFDKICMCPQELLRIDTAAVHPSGIDFGTDFSSAGIQQVFVCGFSIHADADVFFFIVNQNTGTSLFEFFCQFAVSYRGFVQNIFRQACRALYDEPGNMIFLRQLCKDGKFSFIVVFIQKDMDCANLNVVFFQ